MHIVAKASQMSITDPDHAAAPVLTASGPQSIGEILTEALAHAPTDDERCVGCHLPTHLHRTLSGLWVGCKGALAQRRPVRPPERWNDPYPAVTCEARKALLLACGPAMEIHCASYTHDELLTIAHMVAKQVIAAYLREIAK